ncbi:MAG: phosphatidate cytidylyltransferase [Clostridia bacterium]|nr:phosphatidate cytidylyltransferase [Clostridia bacterium]
MKTRIITAVVFAAIGIPIMIFSEYFIFPLALAFLSLLSVVEMLRVCGIHKSYLVAVPSCIIAAALPILASKDLSFIYVGVFGDSYALSYITLMAIVFFIFLLYMAFAAVFVRGKLEVREIAIGFMVVVYLVTSYSSYAILRYLDFGHYLFILGLLIPWGTDISAYFVGTLFGKHKLIPEVSPKKTVEGSIGGVIIATGLTALFGFIVSLIDKGVSVNYLSLVLIGFVLSAVSQLGDLWASIIKRQYGVKDYGNFFPGHGGAIDRFDSVLAVCTLLLLACWIFPPFVAV